MGGPVYSLDRGIYLRRENLLIHLDFAVLLLDVFLPLFGAIGSVYLGEIYYTRNRVGGILIIP